MKKENFTDEQSANYAYYIFWLFDAQVYLASMLKSKTKRQVKQTFERLWLQVRDLAKVVGISVSEFKESEQIESSFGLASQVLIATCNKIKETDEERIKELIRYIESF